MKIKIRLKDPDTLHDAISDAVNESEILGLSEEEARAVKDARKEEYMEIAGEWFEYGEYVMLELDTEAKTMKVLPNKNKK